MNQLAGIVALSVMVVSCNAAYSQSQPEMNEKFQADFEKADARLNAVYKKTLATLDAEGKKKLVAAERAWVAYRDAEAAFEADSERGGSMAPLIYSQTCLELTVARIEQLRKSASE
jgi:uncharacterized protein YecT (DUF1311 family)